MGFGIIFLPQKSFIQNRAITMNLLLVNCLAWALVVSFGVHAEEEASSALGNGSVRVRLQLHSNSSRPIRTSMKFMSNFIVASPSSPVIAEHHRLQILQFVDRLDTCSGLRQIKRSYSPRALQMRYNRQETLLRCQQPHHCHL